MNDKELKTLATCASPFINFRVVSPEKIKILEEKVVAQISDGVGPLVTLNGLNEVVFSGRRVHSSAFVWDEAMLLAKTAKKYSELLNEEFDRTYESYI